MKLAALLVALFSSALPNGPTANDVARALELAQACEGVELSDILSETDLRRLQLLHDSARHASSLDAMDLYWGDSVLLNRWRTQAAPPTLEQVFRDSCMRFPYPMAVIGSELHPGQAAVHENRAWVPLLTSDGDYFGIGLGFVREAGAWRWTEQIANNMHVQVRHPRHERLWRAIRAQSSSTFACEQARLPPPPEPQDLDLERVDNALAQRSEDPANIWGYLQRQAIRYYAGARIGNSAISPDPPSPSAMALWAQTLYATLHFDGAPEIGTPLWDQRMSTAMDYAQRAMQSGIGAPNFAPLSIAQAERLLFHDPVPQRDAAIAALQPALAARDSHAQMLQALLLASAESGAAQVDCDAAVVGLLDGVGLLTSDDEESSRRDLLILAAQIDLSCDVPDARRPQRALSTLQLVPTELRDRDHQRLLAYAQCRTAQNSPSEQTSTHCSMPESLGLTRVWARIASEYDALPDMLPATDPQAPRLPDCP